jgi:hypothetical protein
LFAPCFSAIDSLQECSQLFEELKGGAASQDRRQEGTFACTRTLFLACTYQIWLLRWLGTCVNFIPNSEQSLVLFLLVVCPMLFCN